MSVMLASLSSCSLIDDDLTDCAITRTVECRLHVSSDIDSLLATQIPDSGGQELHDALTAYYQGLLYPPSHSVTINVYNTGNGGRVETVNDTIHGQSGTFTMRLPQGNLCGVAYSPSDYSDVTGQDTIAARQQPLYSGRRDMPQGQSNYTLHMYPANAQVAVAVKADSTISNLQVMVEGCATSFNIADSTYSYSSTRDELLTYQPTASTLARRTFTGAFLPSQGTQPWRVVILAITSTGSITRTVLTVNEPLKPGDIRVLMATVTSDGAAHTTNASVGASVILNWKRGGQYNPQI